MGDDAQDQADGWRLDTSTFSMRPVQFGVCKIDSSVKFCGGFSSMKEPIVFPPASGLTKSSDVGADNDVAEQRFAKTAMRTAGCLARLLGRS